MIISKEVVLHSSKIDWIITEKLEKLKEIMDEDATFIKLPPLGSDNTVVRVTGTTLPLIERSIRRMNKLVGASNRVFNAARSLITSNSLISFSPTPTPPSTLPASFRLSLGTPALKSIFPATALRSTVTIMPSAFCSICSSKVTFHFTSNILIVSAYVVRWPTNYKNLLPERRAGKSTK